MASTSRNAGRTYRGHRRQSFVTADLPELVEVRARQRTFHGAYSRTALGNMGYALTILRLFDRRFYKFGLLFALLSGFIFVIALARSHNSYNDFADQVEMNSDPPTPQADNVAEGEGEGGGEGERGVEGEGSCGSALRRDPENGAGNGGVCSRERSESSQSSNVNIIRTRGQENTRVFGRPFITAGWVVLSVAGAVAAVEIGLLVLIFTV